MRGVNWLLDYMETEAVGKMKKRILFVIENLKVGGIQKSFINMVSSTSDSYEIDLAAFDSTGDYLERLPPSVNVLKLPKHYSVFARPIQVLKKNPFYLLYKACFILLSRLIDKGTAFKIMSPYYKVRSEYDVAIAYSHSGYYKSPNGICPEFVINKTRAFRKICFIHCDYINSGFRCDYNNRLYSKFDRIACCSDSVKKRFLSVVPELTNNTYTVRNFYDLDICKMLPEKNQLDDSKINVFSVARLSREKGIDRGVQALGQSKRKDIRYYIIGDGPQRPIVESIIKEYELQDSVFLLGENSNPCKMLINADYLLVPSLNEAAPMVYDEAKALGVPVISTETTSAHEMLDAEDIICENSLNGLYLMFISLVKPEKSNKHKEPLTNISRMKQFDALVNDNSWGVEE